MPSLLALALAHTLLFVAGVASLVFFRHDATLGNLAGLNPFGPSELARHFFSTDQAATRAAGCFCFASAVPLALYTAVIVARLQMLGLRDTGVYTAFAGGLAASGGLAAAGIFLWVLSVPEVAASSPVVRALHFLVFLSGGPAFAIGMGLLAGGVSVSSHFARVLPKWVVWLGLLVAVTGALSTFGLISLFMTVAIPITRVGGLGWLIAAGTSVDRPQL
jgi:hypothetical protein